MAIEEPSVVAGASSAAKFINEKCNGFNTYSTEPIVIGQISLLNIDNCEQTKFILMKEKTRIIQKCNQNMPKMIERGGGVLDIEVKIVSYMQNYHVEKNSEED